MSKKVELNKTEGEIHSVICKTCKNSTRHKVIVSVDTGGEVRHEYDEIIHWGESYQIIECQGCETISFRRVYGDSEQQDWETGETYEDESIYPKRTEDTWDSKDFHNIPPNLKRIYRETIDCYNQDNLTLCGVGVRALVEGLCKENGILNGEVEYPKNDGTIERKRKNNLQGKINGLHENEKLTKENAEILHEHRCLGNEAVHELSRPTKEELSLAIEIIENVFDTLYESPTNARALKNKRLSK